MRLHREDGSLAQWLHVSKYPPSLSFDALELGIAALILAGALAITARRPTFAPALRVLGSTALFFYLLHMHALRLFAHVFGLPPKFGILAAWAGGLAITLALWPLCQLYANYKRTHRNVVTRFI
jgi:uncharacterized membrane protein YeiB